MARQYESGFINLLGLLIEQTLILGVLAGDCGLTMYFLHTIFMGGGNQETFSSCKLPSKHIVTISSALHLYRFISIWHHFSSVRNISFNISCNVAPSVILSDLQPNKVFILPSSFKDRFVSLPSLALSVSNKTIQNYGNSYLHVFEYSVSFLF